MIGTGDFSSGGRQYRAPQPSPLPYNGYRKLAAAVLADAVTILRRSAPSRPAAERELENQRAAEIEFFRDPRRSAVWCELAGWDWDAIVSKLEKEGALAGKPAPTRRKGPRGAYNGPTIGIGRVEVSVPYREAEAVTAGNLAYTLDVTQQYANRCLLKLEASGRVRRVGQVSGSAKRRPWLWCRCARDGKVVK